ncbi:hypothetical protein [Haloferax sp. ATB1]|uniref:hypothetical protein n=1 Tax=Haloferax sp. ATB1 TaxID=1508454 RepID=UPI0012FEABBA|nr:hypothetical protein [Haloferax sp. ATB1]
MSGEMGIDELQSELATLNDNEKVLGNVSYYWTSWWKEVLFGILTTPVLIGFVVLFFNLESKE